MTKIIVSAMVDPKDLAVNRRYKTNATLPAAVTYAKQTLQGKVFDAIAAAGDWKPPKEASVNLLFNFPDLRNDLDGPIKHTLDALQDGIRQAGFRWNDRAIWELYIRRRIGEPLIFLSIQPYTGETHVRSKATA